MVPPYGYEAVLREALRGTARSIAPLRPFLASAVATPFWGARRILKRRRERNGGDWWIKGLAAGVRLACDEVECAAEDGIGRARSGRARAREGLDAHRVANGGYGKGSSASFTALEGEKPAGPPLSAVLRLRKAAFRRRRRH